MKISAQTGKKEYLYGILCILVGVIVCFPLTCSYIMDGGRIAEWVGRVTEMGNGRFSLFPQLEVLEGTAVRTRFLNSNLWFLVPGLICRFTGRTVLAYRVCMALIQAGTLLASVLLFGRIFREEGRGAAFCGILLYMTCPYRIYVCYDLADISQAVAWMLLPLYIWAAAGVAQGERVLWHWLLTALVLAGIGYADVVIFGVAAGFTLLAALLMKNVHIMTAVAAGGLFFAPGCLRLVRFLLPGGLPEWEVPMKSIMPEGYRLGEYFTSYAFREGKPGMGLGMMLGVLAGIWLRFVAGCKENKGADRLFAVLALAGTVLSFYHFPWELVQRLGEWSLRLVTLIDTPAVFWGAAQLCLCVPAARAVHRLRKSDETWGEAAAVIMVLVCAGLCVYQCNVLTFSRAPLSVI